jgi:hypothetical protein
MLMVRVFDVVVYCAHIVMIDSVFNIIEIFMSLRHTDFSEHVLHLLGRVLSLIHDKLVSVVQLLSE